MIKPKPASHADFHKLIHDLLHYLKLPRQSLADVYSLEFDNGTKVNLLSPISGMLDMVVQVGTLDKNSAPPLKELLAMNLYSPDSFPLSVGVHPVSGNVTLWGRQPLGELSLGDMTALLDTMIKRAESVRRHLQSPRAPAAA